MLNRPVSRRAPASSPGGGLSVPANDNSRLRLVRQPARGRLPFAGRVLRLNPYIGLAYLAWEIYRNQQPEGWDNLGDWVKYCTTASPNPLAYGPYARGSQTSVANSGAIQSLVVGGLSNQAYAAGSFGDPWNGLATTARSIAIGKTHDFLGVPLSRMQYQEGYTRPNQGAFVKPTYRPAQAAMTLPQSTPATRVISINPANAKPGEAPAFPAPIPLSVLPNLKPSDNPNREAEYEAEPSSPWQTRPSPYPVSVPNDWAVSITQPGAAPQSAPQSHTMSPPRKREPRDEKERKTKLSPALSVVLKAVSAVTEGVDFIDALYDALPEQYRPRYRNTGYEKRVTTPQERMKALWENADKIDIDLALQNLVAEHIEDTIYGKIGKVGGEISRRLGRPYGFGMNTTQRNFSKDFYDASEKLYNRVYGEQ